MLSSVSAYLRKQKTYKPKSLPELYQVYRSRNDEVLAYVKKAHVQHWLFEGVSHQYLVLHESAWEVHPINLTQVVYVKRNYGTLCDSDNGPEIAEHENSIAMRCSVNKNYPESLKILGNYVRHTLLEAYTGSRVDMPLARAEREEMEISFALNNGEVHHEHKRQLGFTASRSSASKFTTLFAYSGLNYSKRRGFLVVKNNAVAAMPIKKQNSLTLSIPSSHGSRDSASKATPTAKFRGSHLTLRRPVEAANPTWPDLVPSSTPAKSFEAMEAQYRCNLRSFAMSSSFDPVAVQLMLHPRTPSETIACLTHKYELANTQRARPPPATIQFRKPKESASKKAKDEAEKRSILSQGPYLTYGDMKKEEDKRSRQGWLDKRGFQSTFHAKQSFPQPPTLHHRSSVFSP